LKRGLNHWTNQHPEWINGERNPAAKLSWDKVREIRRRAANGESGASLARAFGVSETATYRVIGNSTWHENLLPSGNPHN
jgi:DNA invertase Pin-like site-specific DNA recombinase